MDRRLSDLTLRDLRNALLTVAIVAALVLFAIFAIAPAVRKSDAASSYANCVMTAPTPTACH